MRKSIILIFTVGILILGVSACVDQSTNDNDTDSTGVQNYDRSFIEDEDLENLIEKHNPDLVSDLEKISNLKLSNTGSQYSNVNISEEELEELLELISDLNVSEVREELNEDEGRNLMFLDESGQERFYLTISYNSDLDQYLINGDILPNSMVDPTRNFKVLNNEEMSEILGICDSLLKK